MKRFLALCLLAALLLTGCVSDRMQAILNGEPPVVRYEDMVYERPDMDALAEVLAQSCDVAAEGESLDAVLDGIWAFYDAYDWFYTNYTLAYIRYNADLTDYYWEQEYGFCTENAATVDASLEELYYALADSPRRSELESEELFGADFFDAYEGESIWDETFVDLMEREAELQGRFYELSAQALELEAGSEAYYAAYCDPLTQVLVELVAVRQQIAAYAGYDSYPAFAYDFYFYRDYTPEQVMGYLEEIRLELVPLYREVNASDVWQTSYESCTEDEMYRYVRDCARAMGGTVESAFELLEEGGLYDIAYSENKYDISFSTYFNSYYEPFIFVKPQQTVYDKLVFVHEFGHFVNDYNCGGSYSGTDVSEIFSQGMEYLSLCCVEGTQDLEKLKLADGLCTYVEQAAYASFEHQLYGLTGDALTVENVQKLYEQVCLSYGFDSWDWDSRDLIQVVHFYTEPMYIISYVVSNDVAFSLYQMEKAEAGAGIACMQEAITGFEQYILRFAENAGMESPFAAGRLQAVRETLEAVLN